MEYRSLSADLTVSWVAAAGDEFTETVVSIHIANNGTFDGSQLYTSVKVCASVLVQALSRLQPSLVTL